MKTEIEKIAFTENGQNCTYKVYKYKEETVRKIKKPYDFEDVSHTTAHEYVDAKVNVTKYALHQEFEKNGVFQDRLVCETEMYATILTIIKGILQEYIETINKMQTPVV